ncbi:hypothetical protein [Bacillus cereus]|uniref:hypothetical protein n=1 Tax=Bacillus cereus TaxID=1396 RepID=UPI000B4A7063|nr:hypothetical protein [Bacillus cereus]
MESLNVKKGLIGDNPVTIKSGEVGSLEIGPIDFRTFLFTTYEASPEKSEVFLVGYDLKGANHIELKFYNKGANDVTIKGNFVFLQ